MIDLLIRGGHVVTPFEEGPLDVGIAGETIAFVSPPGTVDAEAGRTIDASGKLVFPGGVEAHAHIHEPMHRGWTGGREVWLQPPEGATRAAIFGGTTTVVSFAFMDVHVEARELDTAEAVDHRRRIFSGRSYADFAFHPVLTGTPSDATLASLADAVADGTATFKFFTTDLTTTQSGIRLDNGSVRALLAECARLGAVAMVHAEDDDLIKYMEAKLKREGRAQLENAHLVHTNVGEELAVRTVARLAEDAGAALYVAHVCGEPALDAVAERRAAGQPVYGEVLHNCLCFSLESTPARRREVPHRHGSPPARGLRGALARARRRPPLDARDRRVHDLARGEDGRHGHRVDARRPRGDRDARSDRLLGGSRQAGLLARGASSRSSRQPGACHRPLPAKGVLAPGSDADVVLWDRMSKHDHDRRPAPRQRLHPWEGWEVKRMAFDDDPPRQGRRRRRQTRRRARLGEVHPTQSSSRDAGSPALLSRSLGALANPDDEAA